MLEYVWADPQSAWHPVALFGRWAGFVEGVLWRNSVFLGVLAWFLTVIIPFVLVCVLLLSAEQLHAYFFILIQAVVLWLSLGWKSLLQHVLAVSDTGDLRDAQQRVGRIVGRKTAAMDAQDIRRAGIESLAENSSDSIVAPLFWFVLFGVLGAWLYRMVNTLDAMWGYKNGRYLRFGRFAARMDDCLNIVPARLTALLILIQKPSVCSPRIYHQARQHASPNAGYPETSLAFMLGVRLGGPVQRDEGVEHRAWMGVQAQHIEAQHIQQGIIYINRAMLLMVCA
ncbi:MAG: adenosylcobinamide-phosphate synthase CbiB, partial [Ghiorsea sp.]